MNRMKNHTPKPLQVLQLLVTDHWQHATAVTLFLVFLFAVPQHSNATEQPPAEPITPLNLSLHAFPFSNPCPPISDAALVHIDYTDDKSLHTLAERLDIWEVDRQEQVAVALVTPADMSWLLDAGYPFYEDVDVTATLPGPCTFQARTDNDQGIPGYACYRTVEETYTDLASLAAQYPHLAAWTDIGDSWDKLTTHGRTGSDIYALVLTNRQRSGFEKGKLVVMGALHARELTTAEIATRFAELLLAGYGSDPDLTWLLDYNTIHIIPQANPDGRKWAEQGYLWRKNTNNPDACNFPHYGVDLNRNSSFLWNHCNGCSSSQHCSTVYRGPGPASEPETQAIEDYLRAVFGDQRGENYNDPAPDHTNGVFISLHSYGRLIMYPWDHSSSSTPNSEALRRFGRKLGYYTGYQVCNARSCLYGFDGSTTDYAYGALGVASYTYEVGTKFFQDCTSFESSIVEKNLKSLVYAAKAARRPYLLAAGPDITLATAYPQHVAAGIDITLSATADDTRSASNGFGMEPTQPITAARFSINAPSWLTKSTVALHPVDGTFNTNVEFLTGILNTTDLQPGTHTVFLEAQDADGNWGPPTSIFIEIDAPETPTQPPCIPGPTLTPTPTQTPTPPTHPTPSTPTPKPPSLLTPTYTPTPIPPCTPTPAPTPTQTPSPRPVYLPSVFQ